jgi:hypothetical protein
VVRLCGGAGRKYFEVGTLIINSDCKKETIVVPVRNFMPHCLLRTKGCLLVQCHGRMEAEMEPSIIPINICILPGKCRHENTHPHPG